MTDLRLAELDLGVGPRYDAGAFPDGVNIEFVRVQAPDAVSMRVFERGVGETRSCGTGTVAVAAAHLAAAGRTAGEVTVTVPGGVVRVEVDPVGQHADRPGGDRRDRASWSAVLVGRRRRTDGRRAADSERPVNRWPFVAPW